MATHPTETANVIDLAGPWRLALDRDDSGLREHWEARELPDSIALPGDVAGRGHGDPVTLETPWIGSIFDPSYFTAAEYAPYRQPGNIKVPFWLQPKRHYSGAAWYQRDVDIPTAWSGRRILLWLERAHWETQVWLDGRWIGRDDSLSTPHVYELGPGLAPGLHRLTLRIDNRYLVPIGPNSHSISDHTQGNWNGVIGRLELRACDSAWVEELQVHPNLSPRRVRVTGRVGTQAGARRPAWVHLASASAERGLDAAVQDDGTFSATLPLHADAALWDEFSPALHQVTATVAGGDTRTVTFGLREIGIDGTQFTLNGRRIFLRGTLECAIFPLTGHPPTDVDAWKRILRIAKDHGLNHLRFHSWCPPEAAFVAGDELGFYFQVEAASWPNQGATIGSGEANDAWLMRESERIVRTYGNHPCFLFMASGNEPDGPAKDAYLGRWVTHMRNLDDRRLYTCASAWPELPESDYHIRSEPRLHQWGDHLKSRLNARPPETCSDYRDFIAARSVPVVSHEIGQWCVYPDFGEIERYTGHLKPRNFEIFRDSLAAHGMADQARDFLQASGRLQALCYKEEIEAALRTPGMGGFQLLDLHDFPGQGTALVGVLNAFWEEKGYVSPAAFRRFAGPTVPLARLARRVFTTAESIDAAIEVTHFGASPLARVSIEWRLTEPDGETVTGGTLYRGPVPIGSATPAGTLRVRLDSARIRPPTRLQLVVEIPEARAINSWDLWVYPENVDTSMPAGPQRVRHLDDAAAEALESGATVFLAIPPDRVAPDPVRGRVQLGFSSIFWNTAWTNQQAPHTLGILCDPGHPALALYPTEPHSNWHWWYPIARAGAMILDPLPTELRPIVQVIDDWFTNRRLALVFEARVGRGRVLVSSIDLEGGEDPVCRQLLTSLSAYASSPAFNPQVHVSLDQLRALSRP